MTNRAVFLDRDGTMARDVSYCSRPEDFELFPGTARAVKRFPELGFKVIVVTNQSGIGRGYFSEETLAEIHDKMKKSLAEEGAHVDGIYYCPHHPDDNCDCRKPRPGMILRAAQDHDIDLKQSFVIGDFQSDIELGKAAVGKTILISQAQSGELMADYIAVDLCQAAEWIAGQG
ncbi:MAG: D-glycero-beta-D-manno-heptose 1,7-bisphosphate 7-phosphatase [Chloroflexi bacterium]|nr:D-glycero-beta-D-manno-heptose 1,7-bisphosphate 7-phosphatase [Chloroflexota bacterium]